MWGGLHWESTALAALNGPSHFPLPFPLASGGQQLSAPHGLDP